MNWIQGQLEDNDVFPSQLGKQPSNMLDDICVSIHASTKFHT